MNDEIAHLYVGENIIISAFLVMRSGRDNGEYDSPSLFAFTEKTTENYDLWNYTHVVMESNLKFAAKF